MSPYPSDAPPLVLYFDGVCGLCNGVVDWLISKDANAMIRYAMLQGETARKHLPEKVIQDLSTVVFVAGGEIHLRSSAVIEATAHLGGIWRVVRVLKLIPRPLRDAVYRAVAQNRYRWFGKKESCRIPSPSERARFLP